VRDNDSDGGSDPDASAPDPRMICNLVGYEYRSMVIRQLQVTVEWQQTEWLDLAACRTTGVATRQTCRGCPVRAHCLAAALVLDDTADWRGGLNPAERHSLWNRLEHTFQQLRDHDFMQLDRLVDGRSHG
jgi:hypothetical protein